MQIMWVLDIKGENDMQRFYHDGYVYEEGVAQFSIGYTKTPNKNMDHYQIREHKREAEPPLLQK